MRWKRLLWLLLLVMVVSAGVLLAPLGMEQYEAYLQAAHAPPPAPPAKPPLPSQFTLTPQIQQGIELTWAEVKDAPGTQTIRFNGNLTLDPHRLVHVQSRFGGEVIQVRDSETDPKRPLQVGDRVRKGQILAEIWSKDVGEKKSALVDALSNLFLHESILTKLHKLPEGTVPQRTIDEMQRTYESDLIAVTGLRRTLRSWRVDEHELTEIENEARRLHTAATVPVGESDPVPEPVEKSREQHWAEIDVIAPTDGIILEMNLTVGDIIDPSADLLKIADLSRLQVMAFIYEEDLPRLLNLPPEQRMWRLSWPSATESFTPKLKIDRIGHVVDSSQHTAAVMGWIDNADDKLRIGQFVTAEVEVPCSCDSVVVPVTAVIDQGVRSCVLVATDETGTHLAPRWVKVTRRTGREIWVEPAHQGSHSKENLSKHGLIPGEKVVSSGAIELYAKLMQLVVEAPAASPAE